MKSQHVALVLLLIALILGSSRSTNAQTKSTSSSAPNPLSASERDLLTEINDARAHPQTYAAYLEKLKPLFSGKEYRRTGHPALMTEEGWPAVDEAIKFLQAAKPLPPLRLSTGLYLAAQTHVKDQSSSGGVGHKGSDSTFIEERVKPYGTWQGGIGENIAYGDDSARERILTWLIDDGFPSRGHRRRLLSNDFNVAGISCGSHPEFSAVCVLTLAGGFTDVATNAASGGDASPKSTTTTTAKSSGSTKPATAQPSKTKVSTPKTTRKM
jgi:Cysteine-rich secretory protein family